MDNAIVADTINALCSINGRCSLTTASSRSFVTSPSSFSPSPPSSPSSPSSPPSFPQSIAINLLSNSSALPINRPGSSSHTTSILPSSINAAK